MARNKQRHKRRHLRSKRVKRKRQKGGFLNRYGFPYAERDTVNQASKNLNETAPGPIKDFSKELNKITEQRVQQLLDQDEQKLKTVGPKHIKGAIEDTYQTPFKLLGKFSKKKFAEVNQKVNRDLKKYVKYCTKTTAKVYFSIWEL